MSYYSEIQNAFLDGMEEVFHILFTDSIVFQFLDEEATVTNIYDETSEKVYSSTEYSLIGKAVLTSEHGEEPVSTILVNCTITIPTKQLIKNQIPRATEEDLHKLEQGIFTYKGMRYIIDSVNPKTLVADEWQFYEFKCHLEKSGVR